MATRKTTRTKGFTFSSDRGKAFVSKTKVVKDFVSGMKRKKR